MAFKCFDCAYAYACDYDLKCDSCVIIHECENCRNGLEVNRVGWLQCQKYDIDKKCITEHCAPLYGIGIGLYPF